MTYQDVTLVDGRQGELAGAFTSAVTGRQLAIVIVDGKAEGVSFDRIL